MSAVEPSDLLSVLPPLADGDRLDRATFHERYAAMPPSFRAELVEGVVHVPSPLGFGHGEVDHLVAYWLGLYRSATPGLRAAANATVQLGPFSEPQPDQMLRLPDSAGGRSRIDDRGYLEGAPELVVEVALTTRRLDLGPKKRDYERAGVAEYLVVALDVDEIHWFSLVGTAYERLTPDPDGLIRSRVFPGLRLDPAALLRRDFQAVERALRTGLDSPEHAAFVNRLRDAGAGGN